jgi:UDP-N-acetylmuramate-alanine ligase
MARLVACGLAWGRGERERGVAVAGNPGKTATSSEKDWLKYECEANTFTCNGALFSRSYGSGITNNRPERTHGRPIF